MDNVIYLANANRRCADCSCTLAVAPAQARRDPVLALTPTRACDDCGRQVESDVDVAFDPVAAHVASGHFAHCDDCGTEDDLVSATILLPDGLGRGHIFLCADCIARYDEGESAHG